MPSDATSFWPGKLDINLRLVQHGISTPGERHAEVARFEPVTTHQYVLADLAMKEHALAHLQDPTEPHRRFVASDLLLAFLKEL
jgi:hypothetical protein